jgi:zinc protease
MVRVCFVLVLLALWLSFPRFAVAQASAPPQREAKDLLPFPAVEKTLPNGLRVIVVPTGFPNLVSLQIPVQTGSRNEVEPGKSGFAHFFEHMMFRGTQQFPPPKYQAILTRAGARQNAYTTDDFTNYHVTFAKEDLETILQIEADRFQNLSYPPEAFKTEARAVLGEYNKNSANPLTKLIEVQRDHAFTTHTYKHTTMGFLKDIEDMPNQFDYSRQFFDRWYRPEYVTIIVAGDVAPDESFPLVEKYFGPWKRGTFQVEIPPEPAPKGPVYAHVPWDTPTLPWVTVAFHGPAFSETHKDFAAMDLLCDLFFGDTSDLYKRLVEQEQLVDQLFSYSPATADPSLVTVAARVKKVADVLRVRDEILRTFHRAGSEMVPAQRLADAQANTRNGLVRSLDNTDSIASTLARYVRFRRSFETLNHLYRVYDLLTPQDLQDAARRNFTDNRLVVTTLAKEALPAAIAATPPLTTFAPATASASAIPLVLQRSPLPLLNVKLSFAAGSADDPAGKEGLACLTASLIADAGSKDLRIDEINKAFYPLAASFSASVDKEVTQFTGVVSREGWAKFAEIALPMLLTPGFRDEDFRRLRERQLNTLTNDLRANNEEELGKQRLHENLFAGAPYAHPVLGTVAGLQAITLDDVRKFAAQRYTRAGLVLGVAGDASDDLVARLRQALGALPAGAPRASTPPPAARRPRGIEVEIVQKETRATAISFGLPLGVTRAHPDFPALSVARAWLGEHRSSLSHLYQRIREARGMNYGDYAYIEAFPNGGASLFPPSGVPRHAQLFEVWIRPVLPENGHMALRIALYELGKLIEQGLNQSGFDATRDYLMKNVYLLTARQDQQLGYALDSRFYGIGEYTSYMRDRLAKLTLDDVNDAIRRHFSAKDLAVVIVTKDAEGLKRKLLADEFSPIKYDAPKPQELLDEDKLIGALKLGIRPDAIRITPVDEVFAR